MGLAAVSRGPSREDIQLELASLMATHELRFGDYVGGRFTGSLGWIATIVDGVPVAVDLAGSELGRGWTAILELLRGVPSDVWIDLHLWRAWPGQTAMDLGQPFAARELAPVLADIARMYLRIVST
jgi:hypothetical protein